MIVTRSPLRISLGGGGTDLPSYYKNHEGFLIAAAIDKYVYITIHETFNEEIIIKYSELEKRKSIGDIKHPIIRECLKLLNYKKLSIEISSMADIPAGTGLGSSGSFTTALLKALHYHKKNIISSEEIAEQVKEAAEISMGTEILPEDEGHIKTLAKSVVEITDYRANLAEYLKNRMAAVAPNLTILIGELVAAKLIAHSGSLMNLAKQPASTIQILGAEKALFRALKTKKNTPKYGLIYNASVVGQAKN